VLYLCSSFLTLIFILLLPWLYSVLVLIFNLQAVSCRNIMVSSISSANVTASGQVRGASPFQFKHPMTDDLIEIEDENGELLIILTKTAVLEDQLKKANENLAELKQVRSAVFHGKNDVM